MADVVGSRDLDQRLLAAPRRDRTPAVDAWLASSVAHVDTSRFGAADAVAGLGGDELALEFCNAADDRDHHRSGGVCYERRVSFCSTQLYER